jgi:hypothetical protein
VGNKKIICASWIGRFGNRCHSYLYGKHIEDKFGHKFYVGRPWEGSVLFENPAPVFKEFSSLGFIYAGGGKQMPEFKENQEKLNDYNKNNNDSIKLIDPTHRNTYGVHDNCAYINLVTDCNWFFEELTLNNIKQYFEFSGEVKNTDMYKELEDKQGTYDVAHFRRTDISQKNYKGGHSMVSKQSYHTAFSKYDVSENDIIWVSDEHSIGWNYNKSIPKIGGYTINWLADFLKIKFARRIFRSNSSFSLFASWLSDAEIYSPWLHKYAPGEELDFDFVEGNYPHWMSVKGVHASYQFKLKNENIQMNAQKNKAKEAINVNNNNPMKNDKVVMVHWNGRFGNRVFSFMFGKSYADKYGLDFYLPSEWEGTHLFVDSGVKIISDDKLRLDVNQSNKPMDSIAYRKQAIENYNTRTDDSLEFFNPNSQGQTEHRNVFFDDLCVHSHENFKSYDKSKLLKWMEFSDEVKNLDIYKRLEDKQGTYDIAHLRRDDISNANYNKNNVQAYSVVSKESYLTAFKKFGYDVNDIEWTTDDWTGKWGVGKPTIRGGWSYPVGSKKIPDVMFDWLPDFLRLYFARTIFRGNSSFSWVAAFLSPTAKVFSPVLTERKTYRTDADELLFDFVEGNDPHWMNLSNSYCNTIEII